MRSLVAAFAQQQLRDMEQLQRELGRRREPQRPADVRVRARRRSEAGPI
jgi:hypothetical protein